jgi:hypothetical protein
MAKRKAARRKAAPGPARKSAAKSAKGARSARRPNRKAATRKTAAPRRKPAPRKAAPKTAARKKKTTKKAAARTAGARSRTTGGSAKSPRLNRQRRTLNENFATPPSSLDMERHGSAARTGRAELNESLAEHHGMTPALTGGDVDADWENAYFSGDEAPGGDNPTPDQDVVEEIGHSLGVDYQDNEELKSTDKISDRDKHRWELDPASSEDYKDRK